jgi:AdoMet-dependent heme synthase
MALSPAPLPVATRFPAQPFHHLDALWIQVAGTLCNLQCTHCFVSAGPGVETHGFLSRAEVAARVAEALPLGVKEFYFTGGEPFLHPEMVEIVADTLEHGPTTVLTNGTLMTRAIVERLRVLDHGSRYALEIRVSLDGASAAEHDRFRGAGGFARTIAGVRRLEDAGLAPILTITQTRDEDPLVFCERIVAWLRREGLSRLRLKLLPMFRLGREASRTRGYDEAETLAGLPSESFDPTRLPCGSCRAVTSRGVFVCPLLVDAESARMGSRLADALRPFELSHGACTTCYATGMTCGNG